MTERPKVVIIGAGFGGLSLAKKLTGKEFDVLIVDKNNYHTFQPLLYQVATGGLEPDSIAYPIRRILRRKRNIRFRMAEITRINADDSFLGSSIGKITFDYLVIASGSTNNYFNFEPIKDKLLPLKSVTDALDIRSYLMQNLERVLTVSDTQEQAEIVNVAIIGGGPAGLELAGALAEMKRSVLPKDFPEFDFTKMHICLFEASDRLLSAMSEASSSASLDYLKNLGVDIYLNTRVTSYDGHKLVMEDNSTFPTETVLWTAGVKGTWIDGMDDKNKAPGNRIMVDAFNRIIEFNNIFAIGDVAAHMDQNMPKGLPMLAQVAIQQGRCLGENLIRQNRHQDMKPFIYKNKGTMATIGRNKAVVDLPNWHLKGRIAWFIWMGVHLISLVGFRNKLITFIDWAQNYLNYDRPLGLIIRKYKKQS